MKGKEGKEGKKGGGKSKGRNVWWCESKWEWEYYE